MASEGDKQPLLSGLEDSTPETKVACAATRRRFCSVKSAPLEDYVPPDACADGSLPQPVSIFNQLHSSLKKVAAFFGIYLGVGTICFYIVRDDIKGKKTNSILDSLYFCIVTMTTVGYGDLVPDSSPTKLLASVFVFIGVALVGLILSKAADYLVKKQEILLVRAMHMRHKVGPSEFLKEVESNTVKYKCYLAIAILFALMVIGTFFLFSVEELDMIDALYCVFSTITTLGYGDRSFSTRLGRAFAIVWILTSTLGLGQVFRYVVELFTERRQKALVNWVLSTRVTNLDLEAADHKDNDVVIGAAEFILYKLKEMGKITKADISLVMEEFDHLDVDQSGTLSASDLMTLAQATESKK